MKKNLFFDRRKLGSCGRNVIIGLTVRIRYPELVHIGDNCIIDDYTYISTCLNLSEYVHIAAGCKLIGGRQCSINMGSFSTLAPNVVLSAGSDDYRSGIATPFVPHKYKGDAKFGNIEIGTHCVVGTATVVLPCSMLDDGVSIGALSLVKGRFAAWTLYAGIPARKIATRNKRIILKMEREFRNEEAIHAVH